jgi:TPR repeat protein
MAQTGRISEGIELLRPFAEKGNPEAQFGIATGLIMIGATQSNNVIIGWVRKAAAQGLPQAVSLMSEAYRFGEFGLNTNVEMSEMWRKAEGNKALIQRCLSREHKVEGKLNSQ